jgi:hypothetical protein
MRHFGRDTTLESTTPRAERIFWCARETTCHNDAPFLRAIMRRKLRGQRSVAGTAFAALGH